MALKWHDWMMNSAVVIFMIILTLIGGGLYFPIFRWVILACDVASMIYWIVEMPNRSNITDARLAAVVPILICLGSVIILANR